MDIEEISRVINQIAYLSVAVTSFLLFVLIAVFKGKGIVDWMLMLRDLLLAALSIRLFLLDSFGIRFSTEVRAYHWVGITVVCLTLFIALVREHTDYRRKYLSQIQQKQDN